MSSPEGEVVEAGGQEVGEPQAGDQAGGEPQAPQQQRQGGTWQIVRSIAVQLVIVYFITSFFRGKQQPQNPDGTPVGVSTNLFKKGEDMELYVYLTEWEEFDFERDQSQQLWYEELVYGNWNDGPNGDGTRVMVDDVPVPEGVQNNGSWYIHVFIVKAGSPLDMEEEEYRDQNVVYISRLLNKYRKQRIHNTVNLLTGKSDVAPGTVKVPQGATDVETIIVSYYHPNLTINLIDDHTAWVKGSIPQPLDKFIEFDEESGDYYPVVYLNDYWNLAQDYMPLNTTTPTIPLTLTYSPISMLKFNMYAAMTRDNPWQHMLGSSDPTDEEQDTIKQTLMETSPYLLGLTIIVSIVHSVFEFLAFKNDVQFWRSRKSLEGLSVRSVFFNVFQSFIVLLYILDNETNFVVIVSVFVGLLIEVWKVTKVVEIRINREDLIAGVIPRISFVDRPSYSSSTKKYDTLAFKYLGCVLFPLFLCYGVYSLLYHEHKGWYSFVLSMCYGFLLTFGFITMTPQLFINYKLKSVAHLPWRMLTYKALNTFIDDLFAFVIKMPTMYRIGCFRDDIVFFIFLYQRWIYRVDLTRVNEYGTSGEDHLPPQEAGATPPAERLQGHSPDLSLANGPAGEEGTSSVKQLAEKKND